MAKFADFRKLLLNLLMKLSRLHRGLLRCYQMYLTVRSMNSLDWRLKRFKTMLGLARYFKRISEMKNPLVPEVVQ